MIGKRYFAAFSYLSGSVLWFIRTNPDCSQKEIITYTKKGQPRISEVLSNLIHLGLVTKEMRCTVAAYNTTDKYDKVSSFITMLNNL